MNRSNASTCTNNTHNTNNMTTADPPESAEEKKMPDPVVTFASAITMTTTIGHCHPASIISTDVVLESMEDCVGCIESIGEQHTFEERMLKQAAHQRRIATEHGLSEAEAALIRLQMIDTSGVVASSAADGIRSAVETTLSTGIITPQLEDILEQICGIPSGTAAGCLASSSCQNNSDEDTYKPSPPQTTATTVGDGVVAGVSCDIISRTALSADLCDGVILPVDTTLPTSLPGNKLVESKQAKSARSLVDAAAEDDGLNESEKEEDLTIDNGAFYECAICNDSAAARDASTKENTNPLGNRAPSSPPASAVRKPVFCRLPCCETKSGCSEDGPQGGKHSNFKVCTACMLVLTVATKDGTSRVGRCPRCREWISILTLHSTTASFVVRKLESTGSCESCRKVKSPLVLEEPATCDACFLAGETSLSYECEECHHPQTIRSVLYRSQPSARAFGSETSPCNHCEKSTHWRILRDQLPLIPANDVPEEWGDHFLELARIRVQTARQGIAKLDLVGRNAGGQPARDEGCVLM